MSENKRVTIPFLAKVLKPIADLIRTKADKTDILQSDWNQVDETKNDFIKNKPEGLAYTTDIPAIDTTLSVEGATADAKATGEAIGAASALVGDAPVATQIANAISAIPQADFAQNDPNAPDYVKNRTHWEEGVILPETELTKVEQDGNHPMYIAKVLAMPEDGKVYTVVYNNGTPLDCTCALSEVDPGSFILAMGAGDPAEGLNPDAPFVLFFDEIDEMGEAVVCYPVDGSTPTTLSIVEKDAPVHKLAPKFLPETVVMAERPSLGREMVILPETELTHAGGDDPQYALTVRPYASPADGAPVDVTYNGVVYTSPVLHVKEGDYDVYVIGNFEILGETGGNSDAPFGLALVPAGADGVYGRCVVIDAPQGVTISIVQETASAPKQLVMDTDGNIKWEDRTHYKEITTQNVVNLESTELTPLDDDGDGVPDNGQYCLMTPWAVDLVPGGKYTVTYDGVSWECYGIDGAEIEATMSGIVVLGNIDAMGVAGVEGGNPDAPFVFMCIPNASEFVSALGAYGIFMLLGEPPATFEVAVSGVVTTADYKELEERYLPKIVRDSAITPITLTIDENGNVTSDTNFETVWAIDNARLQSAIKVVQNGTILGMNSVFESDIRVRRVITSEGYRMLQIAFTMPTDFSDVSQAKELTRYITWTDQSTELTLDREYISSLPNMTTWGYDIGTYYLRSRDGSWDAVDPYTVKGDLGIVDPVDPIFVVTIDNVADNIGTADKTFAEIKAAHDAGQVVVCKYLTNYHHLHMCDETSFVFIMNACNEQTVYTRIFTITATEVKETVYGVQLADMINDAIDTIEYPVSSVNGKTGEVVLTPADIGATTESYVDSKIASMVDSAPETLNTLNELASALGDDPNFAATVATQIGNKVDKVEGKGLSTNDYTAEEKTKLAKLENVGRIYYVNGVAKGEIFNNGDVAAGAYSHAEGNGTVAIGDNSHAEGGGAIDTIYITGAANSTNYTTSNNIKFGQVLKNGDTFSYVLSVEQSDEGIYTITTAETLSDSDLSNQPVKAYLGVAFGDCSHKEGSNTKAIGNWSHAEGLNTVALNSGSHAEGTESIADGSSHAEGWHTNAHGFASHAEGNNTIANGTYSHAEGDNTVANGRNSHSEGSNTAASGDSSHAEGSNTTASGESSHAEGYGAVASGKSSHAEGYDTVSSGKYSHAEGGSLQTSVKITGDADATTYTSTSTYDSSYFAVDAIITYEDKYATITSVETVDGITTIVLSNTLSADALSSATVKIHRAIAKGDYSHSEGLDNIASGLASHAEGSNTVANGESSHAEGEQTIADGTSHAEGYKTYAGSTSHAEGSNTKAIGTSHTEGSGTYARMTSHAEGANTSAMGYYSHAEGYNTIANCMYQHVQGMYNVECNNPNGNPRYTGYLHIVGNGNSSTRSNAHVLDKNGNARFAGDVYVQGTGSTGTLSDAKIVATQEYVTEAINAALAALGLPTPTTADAGKILRVNSEGKYELVSLPNAEEATF